MTFTRSPSHRSDEYPGARPRPTRAVQRRRLATRRRQHGPWAHHPAPPGGRRVAASAARRPSRLPTKASRRTPGTDGPRTSRAPCDAARVRWSLTGRRSWGGAWSSSVTTTFARRTGCEPSPVQMEPYGPVSRRHHHSHRDRPAVVADDLDLEALARVENCRRGSRRLTGLRGIGRWTAEYVLLRGVGGGLHIFPGDDVGAHNKRRHVFRDRRAAGPSGRSAAGRVLASVRRCYLLPPGPRLALPGRPRGSGHDADPLRLSGVPSTTVHPDPAPGVLSPRRSLKSRREVKWDGGDNHSRLAAEGASQSSGGAVVQELLPAMLDDELGQDDGQREL
jgi:hypothetical protein